MGPAVLRHAETIELGAFCVSEPDAGSDVGGYRTRAVYDEAKDEWVLNGTKAWITNGGIADVHVVVAVGRPRARARRARPASSCRPTRQGLTQGQKYKKHGIRASHTAEVVLDDVRVPGSCLLGGKEKLDERLARVREGKKRQRRRPPWRPSRPPAPLSARRPLGIARAAYEYSLDYAKEREAFGEPIIMNQSIAFMLADMATEIDACPPAGPPGRLAGQERQYVNAEGSMSKLKAGRTAVWVTERAIQILGGYGYTREYPVERWHRDAKIHGHLRRHRADPAAGHLPGHLRPAHRVAGTHASLAVERSAATGVGSVWEWRRLGSMTVTLELPDEALARCRPRRLVSGVSVDDLVAELAAQLPAEPNSKERPDRSFVGLGSSTSGRSARDADEMLAEGLWTRLSRADRRYGRAPRLRRQSGPGSRPVRIADRKRIR